MSAGSGIIWRILEADAVVGGHAIPQGATVVAPIACIHHDAKHWPEPERFLPARFLEGVTRQHQAVPACFATVAQGQAPTPEACTTPSAEHHHLYSMF